MRQKAEMEVAFLKTQRNRDEAGLSLLRHGQIYQAIKEVNDKRVRRICRKRISSQRSSMLTTAAHVKPRIRSL